jgi:Na+-translocating ferredoxin:NAD+ oxidoreductase subunit G
MNKDTKMIITTAVSLFLICAVAAGLLGVVNNITAPQISANSIETANESRKEVLSSADNFTEQTLDDGTVYYTGEAGGNVVGYVFTVSGKGYGGEIELMVGVNTDGAVTGLSILSIDETPGLGMNAKKDSFINQYIGKSGELTVVKNTTPGDSEILAITSATITSKAVTSAVNDALSLYKTVTGQEG